MTVTFTPARYAKGKLVARTPGDGSGFKTPAAYVIERLGGKYVHRDRGYQVSPRQAERIKRAVRMLSRGGAQ